MRKYVTLRIYFIDNAKFLMFVQTLFISQDDLIDPKIVYPPQTDEYPSLK